MIFAMVIAFDFNIGKLKANYLEKGRIKYYASCRGKRRDYWDVKMVISSRYFFFSENKLKQDNLL